jgi:hypothetical protein
MLRQSSDTSSYVRLEFEQISCCRESLTTGATNAVLLNSPGRDGFVCLFPKSANICGTAIVT